ncbi:MAG TPA: oligosaccharide flippase family protein [Bacteroidia bacterium]|jgi:O-antigen/teichoic acid export membrane protein|nr:oligosaccharide flippase family protein [Bacteroidia bacterium]
MGIVQKESIKLTFVIYLGAALGYLNRVLLLTHFLTDTQVGLTGVLMNAAVLYAQFATLGIPSISNRFFPFFMNKEKKHNGFFFWGNVFVFGGFLLTTVLFIVFKPVVLRMFVDNSPLLIDYYYYLIPLAFASVYFQFFESYLRSLLKTVVPTFLNEVFSKILVTIAIALFALKLISFRQFVVIYIGCSFLITLILLVYIIYLRQFHIRPGTSKLYKRLLKPILLYGTFTILSVLGSGILVNIDGLMIASKLSLGQAGIYTTIFMIATALTFPYRSIQKITYPLVGRFWKNRDMKAVSDLYDKTTLIMMIIGGGLILLLWGNINSIFMFIPKEYSIARYSFYLLCFAKYVDMITGLNGIITVTSKKYKYDLYFMLVLVIVTVILNLIFIPLYGITGAALAAMLSLVIYNILRLIFVWVNFKMQPFTWNCLWILLITTGTLSIIHFIPFIINKYISICVNSAIIGIIYMGCILLFKFSPEINNMTYKYTGLKFLKMDSEKDMFK